VLLDFGYLIFKLSNNPIWWSTPFHSIMNNLSQRLHQEPWSKLGRLLKVFILGQGDWMILHTLNCVQPQTMFILSRTWELGSMWWDTTTHLMAGNWEETGLLQSPSRVQNRKRTKSFQEILSDPVSCPAMVLRWSLLRPPKPHLRETIKCVYQHWLIVASCHLEVGTRVTS
jgi:hypothetical protein